MKTIHLVGCGGVAHALIHTLLQTAQYQMRRPVIHLWDADMFEVRNTNRQFLAQGFLGKCKALAFAEYFGPSYSGELIPHDQWFTASAIADDRPLIICVADNHAARRACRDAADRLEGILVAGANETESGEAWIYLPKHKGTQADPFIRYPDLEGAGGNDPLAASAGCTGEVAILDNPQIPSGNHMVASFILWLIQANLLGRNTQHNPAEMRFSRTGCSATSFRNIEPQQESTYEHAA